jgi:hypothetical protein
MPSGGSDFPALYVCQNCGRLAPIEGFDERKFEQCRPGWTHGRLTRVESVALPGAMQEILDRLDREEAIDG